MSAAGEPTAGVSLQGQGGPKPDPVSAVLPGLKRDGELQIIDYKYKQETGDVVQFEFRPVAGKGGYEAVFSVLRSSSSSTKNILDVSKVIEDTVFKTIQVKKKKLKKGFYRVKFTKPKKLDLAKYFEAESRQLSSSDEDK